MLYLYLYLSDEQNKPDHTIPATLPLVKPDFAGLSNRKICPEHSRRAYPAQKTSINTKKPIYPTQGLLYYCATEGVYPTSTERTMARMDSRVIQLTPAAHKYGNLNISSCGKDFFPTDVFGGSSGKAGLGRQITLRVEGFPEPIETDIPTDKNTGRPRWMFRKRKWVKEFVRCQKLRPNDTVIIKHTGKRIYEIKPDNT